MLTKEEREEIAERLKSHKTISYSNFYKALKNEEKPRGRSFDKDVAVMSRIILNLCDTSNMVELPRDKDGEVIRVGDVVYDNSGMEWRVDSIRFFGNGASIVIRSDDDCSIHYPDDLTHKKTPTITSLVGELRCVMRSKNVYGYTYERLSKIANQLESLGDSDD